MGIVYHARQPHLDRLVAIKVLPAEVGKEASFAERFTREARALARHGVACRRTSTFPLWLGVRSLRRLTMHDTETTTLTLAVADGTTMPAFLARPGGSRPKCGLLVFQEAFGVNYHIRDVTERFAQAGYTALAPALFHRTDPAFEGAYTDFGAVRPHLQALTDAGLAADARAGYDWLTASQGGQATAVGAIGFCMGGRVSFLADAELPLRAAVSYYGGGIAPTPHGYSPSLLPRVRDLHGPMLLVWGGADTHITNDQTRAVEDALRAADKPYAQLTFSGAGHGFFCNERPNYEPHAARQAWALTLAFFESYLHG